MLRGGLGLHEISLGAPRNIKVAICGKALTVTRAVRLSLGCSRQPINPSVYHGGGAIIGNGNNYTKHQTIYQNT
ncbi:uncharacterized protein LAJ45_06056 [Morchella importuna]|uniref:uncharacterized protein n=1 Tax=Morchella importuna TaxID=1174673 RepID=UPI001E8E24CF|nr:uncharacterized protein LAJ45_06056 [Morchella importuna]KAH8149904.1 hypothetical protein LAJ45_06056 [Morchella importuna]